MTTLREIEKGFKAQRPGNAELEAFYDQRDAEVNALSEKGSVSAEDLLKLDRLGRFKVADELWAKCEAGAKESLLNDEHHSVRSTAALARA